MGGANDYPRYDQDIFAPDALRAPFAHYRAIRDAGSVVRLANPEVLAIGRFNDVQAAVRAPEKLISGEGVGFNVMANTERTERSVLTSDGDRHRRLRTVLAKPLSRPALEEQRGVLKSLMVAQVDTLLGRETFDAVPLLARHLPVNAISALVGLPEAGRAKMLQWASAFFNTLGPMGDLEDLAPEDAADVALLMEVGNFFVTVDPAHLVSGSWSARLFEAVDGGRLTTGEARGALGAYVIPSLDTTIYAKGNLLYNLACNPDQWALLRDNPSLISSAVLESVRHSAVVRWFSRVAAEDYEAGDVFVPKGERVMVMYGSANRDERRYPDPDRFDVTRNPTDQLGWGSGPHMCVGMHLAKLEMEIMLETLLERVERLEVDAPIFGKNRGLFGIDTLPMRLH